METTFRLKSKEISMAFLKSLKTLFGEQEVEITVRSVEAPKISPEAKNGLLEMIKKNRSSAPIISPDIDIRGLIDDSQCPS